MATGIEQKQPGYQLCFRKSAISAPYFSPNRYLYKPIISNELSVGSQVTTLFYSLLLKLRLLTRSAQGNHCNYLSF